MKVALFVPCYIDQLYPRVAIATLRVLERAGCEVAYPRDQTCCGQPMANAGYEREAIGSMENFVRCFADHDYIVAPSGSCVAHVREHYGALEGAGGAAEAAGGETAEAAGGEAPEAADGGASATAGGDALQAPGGGALEAAGGEALEAAGGGAPEAAGDRAHRPGSERSRAPSAAGPPPASGVRHVRERTYELCEFLTEVLEVDDLGASFPHRVGLHASCHGLRMLGLAKPSEIQAPPFDRVRSLLERVDGLELVDLDRPDECCGFGGTFAVTEEAVSVKMGHDRIRDHMSHGAEVITGTDMSCLMHLEGLIRREGTPLRVMHVAEILDAGRA